MCKQTSRVGHINKEHEVDDSFKGAVQHNLQVERKIIEQLKYPAIVLSQAIKITLWN